MGFLKHIFKPAVFLCLFAFVLILNNGSVPLWNQDEAAYAGFAKTMLQSGDWLIPQFDWSDPHRKTPLHFWMIAFCYLLGGIGEFMTRLPVVILIWSTVYLLYKNVAQLFSERMGVLSGLILSSNLLVFSLGKMAVTDAGVLFFSTVCGIAILWIMRKKSTKWMLIFWLSLSLAMLQKGPTVLLFTGAFGLLILIFQKDRYNILRLKPWIFAPLSIIPLALWVYLAWQRDDGVFISWLVDWYTFSRVGSSVYGQTGPPGYYLVSFLLEHIYLLPFVLLAVVQAFFTKSTEYRIIGFWFIAGWLAYELLSSKLPAYIVPALPALAILMAKSILQFDTNGFGSSIRNKIASIIHFLIIVAAAVGLLYFSASFNDGRIIPAQILASAIMILGVGLCYYQYYWQNKSFFNASAAIFSSSFIFLILMWGPVMNKLKTKIEAPRTLPIMLEQKLDPNTLVVIQNSAGKIPSLPFYISEKFINYSTSYNFEDILNTLARNEPLVLILDASEKDKLKTQYPKLHTEKISTFILDGQKNQDYHIVWNQKAEKK